MATQVIMITKYNRKSLAFGCSGILLQMGWWALIIIFGQANGGHSKALPEWEAVLFGASLFTGAILWIMGLCYYAMAKGYRASLGLLGLFSLIGLLILFVLPDKTKS